MSVTSDRFAELDRRFRDYEEDSNFSSNSFPSKAHSMNSNLSVGSADAPASPKKSRSLGRHSRLATEFAADSQSVGSSSGKDSTNRSGGSNHHGSINGSMIGSLSGSWKGGSLNWGTAGRNTLARSLGAGKSGKQRSKLLFEKDDAKADTLKGNNSTADVVSDGTTQEEKYRTKLDVSLDDTTGEGKIFDTRNNVLVLVAATKEKFLTSVLQRTADQELVKLCVNTYDYVFEPQEFLGHLVRAFKQGITDGAEPDKADSHENVRGRVVGILRKWIQRRYEDFACDVWLMDALVGFVGDVLPEAGHLEDAKVLRGEIHTLVRIGRDGPVRWHRTADPSLPMPHIPKRPASSRKLRLVDILPVECARQLCLLEHERFSAIPLRELCRQAWAKEDGEAKAPKLVAQIASFNDLTVWSASEVVAQNALKARIAVLKSLIRTAVHCMTYNNLSSALAIVAGLHDNSVARLKKTWKGLSSKYMELFNDITRVLQGSGNFKEYRELLANAEPPVSPYLGVTLRDLTFIEDGNNDFFDKDLLNIDKFRMISKIFNDTQRLQRVPYRFELIRQIRNYLVEAPRCTPEQLKQYSLLCEPRVET